jgi:hypothetical protein
VRALSRRVLLDLALAALVLYASFWVYEFGNLSSLALSGAHVSLAVSGFLPVGTTAIFSTDHAGPPPILAKIIQVVLSVAPMLMIANLARRGRLVILEGATICVVSLFGASLYWESLSLLSSISITEHQLLYFALTVGLEAGLMRAMKYSPAMPGRGTRS